ncbi:hypothetical protein ACJJTC_006417 [Scirpophaga incertulas]
MVRNSKMYGVLCAVILPLFLLPHTDAAAVISIDLGSEWMKIGIVSPGVPMEIVLNKESKRKTPAVVAFRDGVRTFGEDAVSVGVRFPKNSYKYLLDLLGKSYDHPLVQAYKERYPYYEIVKSKRGTPEFIHDEKTRFSPEELVAQLLAKAKEFAEISHGQQISECVITVPGYFNQAERRALKESATLAGLNVLQLINDYTAIAINYGIFRRKEINETAWQALFFDMGAASTKAALVEYKRIGFDRTLGGHEMTLRLREHLIKAWEANGGSDVRASPRAMEKLLREAERLKVVLSANTEHYAQIESLLDDKDFKQLVTRAEFEELCSDLWARVAGVVERAVKAAGVGEARLIVAGGGARAPAVLQALRAAGYEPARSINADEAATMGAVYRAASLATGYKVAALNVRDAVLLPIQVIFSRNVDGTDKLIKRTLFGPMNPYPQKKVITFNKHTDDFSFNVNYAELDHIPPKELEYIAVSNLTHVSLSGVSAALTKHTGENIEHKGIKAHFNLDDSGILNLVNVEFVAEKIVSEEEDEDSTLSKIGSTISKLFSSDSDTPEKLDKPEEKQEDKPQDAEKSNATKANETTTEKQNATETEKAKPKVVMLKEPIKTNEEILTLLPLSPEQFNESKDKIKALNTIDKKRIERETALNNLEAFVVDAQMKIDMEEYAECGTSEQIEELKKICGETSEWLYEDGYEAATELFEEKLAVLKEKANPIFYKHWEHRERPEAVAAIRNMINSSKEFLKMAKNFTKESNPERDIFTSVEIEVLEKKIAETETWLNKTLKEQKALKKNEEIKLTVDSIREKMAHLDREMKYLLNKMKIWRPKTPIKKATNNKTEEVVTDAKPEKKESKKDSPVEESKKDSTADTKVNDSEKDSAADTTEPPLQLGDGNNEHSEL